MRILIIQLRRIGDILLTTPVIGALRAAFPDARIEFLSEPMGEPVLRGQSGLDELILLDKGRFLQLLADVRRRKYDWVLDFINTPRSAQVAWVSGAPVRAGFEAPFWGLAYNRRVRRDPALKYIVQQKFDLLRALGLNPAPALPRIPVTDADFSGAQAWWDGGPGRFPVRVGMAPAHRHPVRQWPARKWAALLPLLLKDPRRAVVLFGGPGEEGLLADLAGPHPDRVFPLPTGPLRQAAAVMAKCGVVASNCSGSMHLAVAAGTPTVTIYGSSVAEVWNPRTPPHRVVRAEGLACIGCHRNDCPYGHECMEWVSPERVAGELEGILKKTEDKNGALSPR